VTRGLSLRTKSLLILLTLSCNTNAQQLQLCHDAALDLKAEPTAKVGERQVTGTHNIITATALDKLGIDFQLVSLPWVRCLHAVSTGSLDGAIGVGWTPERSAAMVFPQLPNGGPDPSLAMFVVDYYVYTLKQSSLSWDGENFSGVRFGIAAPKGFIAASMLKEMGVHTPIEAEANTVIKLTVNRRIDGYVQSRVVAQQQLANSDAASLFQELHPVFFHQPLYLVFSQQAMQRDPQQLLHIWQSLPEVKATIPSEPGLCITLCGPQNETMHQI
jgi:polar amino acid transport system substrate-binding protein